MLRSYDTRFRESCRWCEVYDVFPENTPIVGDVELITEITDTKPSLWLLEGAKEAYFWLCHGFLKMIVTQFKPGHHYARSPLDFVPVIEQLELLHSRGYVHGNIRAFNVVFAGKDGENVAGLIDFDLSGKDGVKKYPPGYDGNLGDGDLLGSGDSNNKRYNKLQYLFP